MSDTEPVGGCYAASSISFSCIKGEHFCIFPIIQISSFLSLPSLCFFTFAKICKYKYDADYFKSHRSSKTRTSHFDRLYIIGS